MRFRSLSRREIMMFTAAMIASPASAQSYIDHVHFLIAFPQGASFDKTCRATQAALMASGLAKTATSENLVGRGGAAAIERLLDHSVNNQNTLMLVGTSIIARGMRGLFPYELSDLTLVCLFSAEVLTFGVKSDSRFKSLGEVLAALKANPSSVRFCSDSDVGLTEHLCAAKMLTKAGIQPKTVTYIPRTDESHITAVLAGEAEVVIAASADILTHYQDKSVRVLAVSADNRVAKLPDVPTLSEVGVPDAAFYNARGFFMAPGTELAQVTKMGEMLEKMVITPQWEAERAKADVTTLFARLPKAQDFFLAQERDVHDLLTALGILK